MAKQMTPAEVVAELRRRAYASLACAIEFAGTENDRSYRDWGLSQQLAADIVEQHLVPQVLDKPDGPGDYWIEGVTAVCRVGRSSRTSQWMYYDGFGWESLSGRCVAKVPPGPFAGEATQ